MKRGDLVTVAPPGEYGKPCPALVVQSHFFAEHPSVTICLLTPEVRDAPLFRLTVQPSPENGLHQPSQIMIDKIVTISREKIGGVIGRLEESAVLAVNRALALWVGIA